ncbi:MAG: hypothetical protein N2441_07210 [Rhodocyclaceae bacterium]|nr:hypothetical protein [Rhodocyclaceae bacterium]
MRLAFLMCSSLLLAACEQLGIEDPAKAAAAKEAEGRAVGGACRHAGRALEDCYTLNPKVSKAAIYAGWREMDAYMRENNIEVVPPQIARPEPASGKKKKGEGTEEPQAAGSSDQKALEPASPRAEMRRSA